jgi:hypothetical protein
LAQPLLYFVRAEIPYESKGRILLIFRQNMKTSMICTAICAAMLAFSHEADALALTIGDSHELGFLWPSIPSGNQDRVTYVNHLVGMALGSIDIANGQIYFRSNNAFGSLPTAVWAVNGTGTTINLGTGGTYTYLFANYAGYGAEVWYVGNLTGIITIPAIAGLCWLTDWTLFGPGGGAVPDGGITVMLLGLAIFTVILSHGFAMKRRKRPGSNNWH